MFPHKAAQTVFFSSIHVLLRVRDSLCADTLKRLRDACHPRGIGSVPSSFSFQRSDTAASGPWGHGSLRSPSTKVEGLHQADTPSMAGVNGGVKQ